MDETLAYFAVVGRGRADAVTAHLKLQPSRTVNEGDRLADGISHSMYMKWSLDSGLKRDKPFHEHIAALLALLEPRAEQLHSMSTDYARNLECVGYFHSSNPGFTFEPRTLARIAALGLELGFDIYNLGGNDDG